MKTKLLGNTQIKVSEIAFGGVEIGMPYGLGVKDEEGMLSDGDAVVLLRKALEEGINFFDTARLYGKSENLMGKAFEGTRQDVVICTKCTHFKDADGSIPPRGVLERLIQRSLKESLKALRTDYIDVFMVHMADLDTLRNPDVARIFTDLRTSGTVRAIGVSVYTPAETDAAIKSGCWNLIQLPFNLLNQQHLAYFNAAKQAGVAIVVRSVLLQGLLSDGVRTSHEALRDVSAHIDGFRLFAEENSMDLAAFATQFALSFEEVAAVLVGIDRLSFLDSALQSARTLRMPAALKKELQRHSYSNPDFINLHQWKLQGFI